MYPSLSPDWIVKQLDEYMGCKNVCQHDVRFKCQVLQSLALTSAMPSCLCC
eukprot:m.158641 g.158641  ORF g.158641 m.158641 type:complete len:51 (-) comp16469_c1_seq36:167-319(-)